MELDPYKPHTTINEIYPLRKINKVSLLTKFHWKTETYNIMSNTKYMKLTQSSMKFAFNVRTK